MRVSVKQIFVLMFGLFSLCIFQGTAAAQASAGYVSTSISPNPAGVAQNVLISSSITACMAGHSPETGTAEYYVSTTASGAGTYIGNDRGTGLVWNTGDGPLGYQGGGLIYYISAQYIPASYNGNPDPCLSAVSFSPNPIWTELVQLGGGPTR